MLSNLLKVTKLHNSSWLKPRHSNPTTHSTTRSRINFIVNISAILRIPSNSFGKWKFTFLLVKAKLHPLTWDWYIKSSYIPSNGPEPAVCNPMLSNELGSLSKFFTLFKHKLDWPHNYHDFSHFFTTKEASSIFANFFLR